MFKTEDIRKGSVVETCIFVPLRNRAWGEGLLHFLGKIAGKQSSHRKTGTQSACAHVSASNARRKSRKMAAVI